MPMPTKQQIRAFLKDYYVEIKTTTYADDDSDFDVINDCIESRSTALRPAQVTYVIRNRQKDTHKRYQFKNKNHLWNKIIELADTISPDKYITREQMLSFGEVKSRFPIGSIVEDEGHHYKVTKHFDALPTVQFASFPGYVAELID